MSDETPTLGQVIKEAMEARLMHLHTCFPAQVVSYDSGKQLCNVQPQLLKRYTDGTKVKLPQVNNVPVVFPRAGKGFLSFPIEAGDQVLVLCTERSIDLWIDSGGLVEPGDVRKHSLSDAVAIPGLYPTSNPAEVSSEDVLLKYDKAEIHLKKSGKFLIKNDSEELISLIDEILEKILAATTNTMLGPQPWINLADFAAIKSRLATLKG